MRSEYDRELEQGGWEGNDHEDSSGGSGIRTVIIYHDSYYYLLMVLWSHHVVTAAIKEYLMRYENDIIHFLLASRNCKKRFNQTLKALCSEHSVLLFLRLKRTGQWHVMMGGQLTQVGWYRGQEMSESRPQQWSSGLVTMTQYRHWNIHHQLATAPVSVTHTQHSFLLPLNIKTIFLIREKIKKKSTSRYE